MTENVRLTTEFFDRLSATWDEGPTAAPEKLRALLISGKMPAGARALDVACGTGVLISALLEAGAQSVRAIDISRRMAALAEKKFAQDGRVIVSAGDFYEFAQGGFDVVTVYNAYPHFLDRAAFARAAARCLLPGGRLIIAHGDGRQVINSRHTGDEVKKISSELLTAREEAQRLPGFSFDVTEDCADHFLLSGVRDI